MIVSGVIHQTPSGLAVLNRRRNYWSLQDYFGDGYDAVRHFLSDPNTLLLYQKKLDFIDSDQKLRLKELDKTSLEKTPADNLNFDEIKFAIELGAKLLRRIKIDKLKVINRCSPKPIIVGSFNSSKG